MQGSAIPPDGKLLVTFPSAYTLTGVTSCAAYVVGGYTTIDGTFSVSTSGNDVTCTRANDGTVTSAGGSHAITVETIANPTSGGTQTFAFATLDSSDATIDQGSGATIEITDEAALNDVTIGLEHYEYSSVGSMTVRATHVPLSMRLTNCTGELDYHNWWFDRC